METVTIIRVDPEYGDESSQATLNVAVEETRKQLNEGGLAFSQGQQITKDQSDEEIKKQMEAAKEVAFVKKSPAG